LSRCIRSLGDPLFDTWTSQGRLLVTMLAAIAEFERELIRGVKGKGGSALRPMASSSVGRARSIAFNSKRRSDGGREVGRSH
jgi:hypothetical protein